MKAVLIDASSSILLYKSGLFDVVSEVYRLVMTPAVFREVTVEGRSGANHFGDLHRGGGIDLTVAAAECRWNDALLRLGAGERETLCAFTGGDADFVILDDRKGV